MAKKWNRTETWVTLIVLGIAAVVMVVVGVNVYMTATAMPIHPDPTHVPSAADSDPSPKWSDAVARAREISRAGLSQQNLPGLSVAVGVGGEVVWAEGFGWANLENRVPVTPESRFRIGTASTVLTSAAVGLLLEKDRLKLDQPIQTYVPEFPTTKWPVTLRQVLAHTSGLRSDSSSR